MQLQLEYETRVNSEKIPALLLFGSPLSVQGSGSRDVEVRCLFGKITLALFKK